MKAAIQEVETDEHVHVAYFTRATAVLIRQKLLAAGHASSTLRSKRYLIEMAASVDTAIVKSPGEQVAIFGRRGFLRFVASQAGPEELLRVEREMQGVT